MSAWSDLCPARAGLYHVTSAAPTIADAMPTWKSRWIEPQPSFGGSFNKPTTEFTMGAPAKTMVMTTAGWPPAPKARSTAKAPMAPTMPAKSEIHEPAAGKRQSARASIAAPTAPAPR